MKNLLDNISTRGQDIEIFCQTLLHQKHHIHGIINTIFIILGGIVILLATLGLVIVIGIPMAVKGFLKDLGVNPNISFFIVGILMYLIAFAILGIEKGKIRFLSDDFFKRINMYATENFTLGKHDGISFQKAYPFAKSILALPLHITEENSHIIGKLQTQENLSQILEISDKILKMMEKIAKYQKILPFFFKKEYLEKIQSLVKEEIIFLKDVLDFVTTIHISHIDEKISEIENISQNQEKFLFDALDLQKKRLENQKKMFEKFL